MKLDKKCSPIIREYTEKKLNDAGVVFDSALLDKFKNSLRNMAEKNRYKEGDRISNLNRDVIALLGEDLMKNAVDNLKEEGMHVKVATSPEQYFLAMNDYLTAVVMEEMGYPEIPNGMFNGILSTVTEEIIAMKPDPLDSSKTYFDNQRGKNVDQLAGGVMKLVGAVSTDASDYRSLAELYAEYHALTKRQENHGAVWRFFHKKENESRNALLSVMKQTLESRFTDGEVDFSKEPSDVYREGEWRYTNGRINIALNERLKDPARAFGYYNYQKDPSLFEAYEKEQMEKTESKELENKVDGQVNDRESISNQVKTDVEEVTEERSSKLPESLEKKSVTKEML